jgi:hypothetical protein
MFIDWHNKKYRRGSEGRNKSGLVLVKLSSAPPHRAGEDRPYDYKHATPTE